MGGCLGHGFVPGDQAAADGSMPVTPDGGLDVGIPDDGGTLLTDGAPADARSAFPLTCGVSHPPVTPNPCPAPSGTAGQVDFCFRPGWSGVTSVEVRGGFGQPTDWKAAFLTLTNDGTGTFTGHTALANGSYPYAFLVHGGDDHLTHDPAYLLDQLNPQFVPAPPGAPGYSAGSMVPRSVSSVTVPQVASPTYHLRGSILYQGVPQPCFSVDLEVGEVVVSGLPKQEHNTANFAESGLDGTFDFPVAAGIAGLYIRFPFFLSGAAAPYPDPGVTPLIAFAATNLVLGADKTLDALEVAYPDYSKMAPTDGGATVPVTFLFTVIPGAAKAAVAVKPTNIAGNDPTYSGPSGTTGMTVWDGTFAFPAGSMVVPGKTYYWGTRQSMTPKTDGGTAWSAESLLFPLTFH
jgi:hypothetical protein